MYTGCGLRSVGGVSELPFVDVHRVPVRASRDAIWSALIDTLAHLAPGHGQYARLVGCDPATLSPQFAGRVGETVPGFRVAESEPGHRLALAGRHRFSRYTLTFRVDDEELSAETHAAFPGVFGRLYRTAVIGTRGHVLLTAACCAASQPEPNRAARNSGPSDDRCERGDVDVVVDHRRLQRGS